MEHALLVFWGTALLGGAGAVLLDLILGWGLETLLEERRRRRNEGVVGPTETESQWIHWCHPEAQA